MSNRLKDKVAIISGAGCIGPGWGNGRAAAVRFCEEGARVFAVDRSADAMEETLSRARAVGGEISSHISDATDGASVASEMWDEISPPTARFHPTSRTPPMEPR